MDDSARVQRGAEIEGYAFTFCKAAFLALLFGKFAVLALSTAAVILYVAAYALGVRQWRCWVKPPWVVIFYAGIAALQAYLLFWHPSHVIL